MNDQPAWFKTYSDIGMEVMPAPNKYRKLFKGAFEDVAFDGSHAMQWFFLAGFDSEGEFMRETALEMMKADWPDKADRAIGMEPAYTLHDVILLWRLPSPGVLE